ncbi:hypothetical protein RRG08_014114 [Elysia crispata]|uniref:Uncharacterized protein n=1 Tax=Elysia crispata TaxID=231223 RepID=A0AAE0ZX97_9GAST|nr:hypothetical protein RRG08_014114 [Elysia crispata]
MFKRSRTSLRILRVSSARFEITAIFVQFIVEFSKMSVFLWSLCSFTLGLVLAGFFFDQAMGQSHQNGLEELCSEPANLMELYWNLRELQIIDSSILQEPSPTGSALTNSSPGGQTLTRLTGHYGGGGGGGGSGQCSPGFCRCEALDELNHDPARIPRMIAQSSCRPYRPRRIRHYSVECEEIYMQMRVKRRHGCLNDVYQYRDAWEAIPAGCRCHVYPRVGTTRV